MKGSIEAINQEAREHGMSYGKYMALRAGQQAPVGEGRRPDYEAGRISGLGQWRPRPLAQKAPASGTEEETTAKPKRVTPPGASLGLAEVRRRMGLSQEEVARKLGVHMLSIKNWEQGKNRPRAQFVPALARLYGLEAAELRQTLGLEEPGRERAAKRGQALRQARLRAGLSLEEAALRMNVTAAAVRQWETGKNRPKWQSQRKIAQVYGLELKALERTLEEVGL